MNFKLTFAVAGIAAMTLSSFAQGGPGPGPGPGGPGGPGMGRGPAAPVDWSKLPPASDKKGVTYAADIKPLLDANCVSCHGAANNRTGLRLDSLEGIMAGRAGRGGGPATPVVVTSDGAASQLVRSVSRLDRRTAMPQQPRARRGGPGMGGGPNGPDTNAAAAAPAPPPPKNFTPEEVGLVRAWIDQGAK